MDHQTAADSNAAERYTLGEMSAEERDAFEEHYFDCHECAAEVRTAEKFADGVRTLPPIEQVPNRTPSGGTNWWAAAAAVFAVALGVQTWMAPVAHQAALPAMRALTVQQVAAASRGGTPQIVAVGKGEPAEIAITIPPDLGTAPEIELRDAHRMVGKLRQRMSEQESSVYLDLNVPPGTYTIIARGNGAVAEYPITVRPR